MVPIHSRQRIGDRPTRPTQKGVNSGPVWIAAADFENSDPSPSLSRFLENLFENLFVRLKETTNHPVYMRMCCTILPSYIRKRASNRTDNTQTTCMYVMHEQGQPDDQPTFVRLYAHSSLETPSQPTKIQLESFSARRHRRLKCLPCRLASFGQLLLLLPLLLHLVAENSWRIYSCPSFLVLC